MKLLIRLLFLICLLFSLAGNGTLSAQSCPISDLNDDIAAAGQELIDFFEAAKPNGGKAWNFIYGCPQMIRRNADILRGINGALQRGVKEVSDVLDHGNIQEITDYTVTHIFRGHGANGGRHHISSIIGDPDRKLVDRLHETTDGFYEAVFSNGNKKSFWPDQWDEFKVIEEIEYAFPNKRFLNGNTWEGFTSSGQKIWMYLRPDGSIISAFPVLN